jgi:hypothetical protein
LPLGVLVLSRGIAELIVGILQLTLQRIAPPRRDALLLHQTLLRVELLLHIGVLGTEGVRLLLKGITLHLCEPEASLRRLAQ